MRAECEVVVRHQLRIVLATPAAVVELGRAYDMAGDKAREYGLDPTSDDWAVVTSSDDEIVISFDIPDDKQ